MEASQSNTIQTRIKFKQNVDPSSFELNQDECGKTTGWN